MNTAQLTQIVNDALFDFSSFESIILRALIWFGITLIIIISVDSPDPQKSMKSLKSNLGFFLMFVVLSTTLIGMLFSFVGVPA